MGTFTKGLARDVVDAQGEHAALGGHSLRPEHFHHLLLKAYTPKTAVPAQSLETAIASWETDIRSFQDATGDKFPEANRKMGLINMCPDKLSRLRQGQIPFV